MIAIKESVGRLNIKEKTSYKNLTVFPLRIEDPRDPDYLTLDQAMEARLVQIKEISTHGSVPELLVENSGVQPVLLLDGEELVGAKQNRVLNVTILVPAKAKIYVPVSCVEGGRWSHTSPDFRSSGQAQYARGRAGKAASVSASMDRIGSRHSDQGQVWSVISRKLGSMELSSPTAAMGCIYEENRDSMKDYREVFSVSPDQAGAVFGIGERVAGVEFFDSPSTFRKLFPKILQSYAIDAMELRDKETSAPDQSDATGLLSQIAETPFQSYPAVGMGTDLRVSGKDLVGGGLVVEDQVIHFVAFVR